MLVVFIWIMTGHWLLMDAMGMGLCVAFIAFVRLPSLKVSTLLLSGLLLYDVFWVFFSQYVFNANVMVKVATRPADNPVGAMARKLHIGKDTWGKKKFNSTISQRFVTSTGNIEVLFYNAHSILIQKSTV